MRGEVEQSKDSFAAFAERETAYFINFYRKWMAEPRLNALAVAYEDLIGQQERTLAAVVGFITGKILGVDQSGARTCARRRRRSGAMAARVACATRCGTNHFDPVVFARLEHRIAHECGKDRIRFHFLG